ncbi:Pre-mRNA-splicing factor of RES complex-domain-containing protein [Durotheca rogersii]|uniref:Pre-mRNA-splicing factor of RES complex-domain-containing protein n=1 Tax=Durotheca rogersii TaxID=419775 RepID=UPI00222113AE|nr:Pre-mRNA-splicing factor of RES complex-domain-containing protein [Durotheca rogersii]KAI5866473.1 Pre-mRNA-splicing factor of RES complex-domain-containing protein [Durotheca rogersii]
MPSDLSNYLATRYLVADPKPSKKRKRKPAGGDAAGLIIADDDESGWASRGDDGADGEGAAVVAGTSAEFRRAKKSGWKAVGGAAKPADDGDAAEAAAVLASAAAETAAETADADAPVLMSDGTHAGLQSGAAVAAQLEARRRAEREDFERSRRRRGGGDGEAGDEETVYRDATGRRVDASMRRAELRREAEAAAAKRAAAERALRGEVQEAEGRRRRERLDDAKLIPVARHADDAEINREMRDQVRWGDTMAQFIGGGGGGGGEGKGKAEKGKGKKKDQEKGRPIYQGAWAPNRYQIRPGYRWDGVDRSNGFEAERFKAINRRERNKGLEYAWQMDE